MSFRATGGSVVSDHPEQEALSHAQESDRAVQANMNKLPKLPWE